MKYFLYYFLYVPVLINSDNSDFKVIEHADFPARYDYSCASSKAEWGCVFSIKNLDEARKKCKYDEKCKAFVVMPHLKKPGWNIVIFKNDAKQPVDHKGTFIYIKLDKHVLKSESALDESSNFKLSSICDPSKISHEILPESFKIAKKINEQNLISSFEEKSIQSDRSWLEFLSTAQVSENQESKISKVFEPTGSGCTGGQVKLTLANSIETTFFAKRDTTNSNCGYVFDVLHLAMFYVDRILGIYSVPPCTVRKLTAREIQISGFPIDIGGDYFDRFKSYKNKDGSLTGVLCLSVLKEVNKTRFLKLAKFSSPAGAITYPTKTQKSQVEYLMLAWICGIDGLLDTTEEKMTYFGRLFKQKMVHLKGDDGFDEGFTDFDQIRMYLNNCWFPQEVYERIQSILGSDCSLGGRVKVFLDAVYPRADPIWVAVNKKAGGSLEERIDINLMKLMEVIDTCMKKHGDEIFYTTEAL